MKLLDIFKNLVPKSIAFVGAGGKTTTIFELAKQFKSQVFVTTTTKISVDEKKLGDHWFEINTIDDLNSIDFTKLEGVTVFTGAQLDDIHMGGLNLELVERLNIAANEAGAILLIEADGAKKRDLKAPLEHEPVIPGFIDAVVVSAGMNSLGRLLNEDNVHRSVRFSELSGTRMGDRIELSSIMKVMLHDEGGLKGIPSNSLCILHLTQISSEEMQQEILSVQKKFLSRYSTVVLSDRDESNNVDVKKIIRKTAGIILAGGDSSRFGQPKQLLDWFGEPIVRKVAKTALLSNLSEIIVVTGEAHQEIKNALVGLDVRIVENSNWSKGISSSIRAGLEMVTIDSGSAMFILADQPQIPYELMNTLIEVHQSKQIQIIYPLIKNKRGNPVLFDRVTFGDLRMLEGDSGGRQIFSKFENRGIPFDDNRLNLDIDSKADYEHLKTLYK